MPSEASAVLRLHSLGDVVLCQPAASLLAETGEVRFLVSGEYIPIVERFGPGVIPVGIPARGAASAIRRALSSFRPDRVVDLQGSFTTMLGTWPGRTSRFRMDRRRRGRVLRGEGSMPLRYVDFCRTAGFAASPPPVLERRCGPAETFSAGLVCGGRWRLKSIPEAVIEELARLFGDLDGASVTLIGGPEDAESIDRVAAGACRSGIGRYCGEGGVAGLLDVLERQHLVVSPDSGPAHAARALGIPTLVVFTSTSTNLGFWSSEGTIGPFAPCSPCHRHGGLRCRRGDEECRRSILPLEVYRAARALAEPL